MDQFLVCKSDYKSIRDAVAKAMMEGKMERIQKTCDVRLCVCLRGVGVDLDEYLTATGSILREAIIIIPE